MGMGSMSNRAVRPPNLSGDRLQAAVAACVEAGAELVYLFGSQARGKVWPESDVDLDLLLRPKAAGEQHGEIQARLIGELMIVLGSKGMVLG